MASSTAVPPTEEHPLRVEFWGDDVEEIRYFKVARAEGTYLPSFYVYLVIAGVIGAVGIITNSQILIVAAMVVGPEYGAITSVALGIDRRNGTRVRQGLIALTVSFLLAVLVTFLFSWGIRWLDLQPRAFELGVRPVSSLIDAPDVFSVVVAVLAGIVGIMSLTQARTSALLGVFISVTTIPAAADIGVSCAFSSWSEARGSRSNSCSTSCC
ncbi:hypothetical protein SVIOM74S_09836 [Streptomyces violarus]